LVTPTLLFKLALLLQLLLHCSLLLVLLTLLLQRNEPFEQAKQRALHKSSHLELLPELTDTVVVGQAATGCTIFAKRLRAAALSSSPSSCCCCCLCAVPDVLLLLSSVLGELRPAQAGAGQQQAMQLTGMQQQLAGFLQANIL
jgi:hypothetical protein